MEGKVEQSRAGAQRSLWKLTRGKRIISEQEPGDGRGWLVDRKENHTEHLKLVTRMGRSRFPISMLVGLIFKYMLLTKLF